MLFFFGSDLTASVSGLKAEMSALAVDRDEYVAMESIKMSPEHENIEILKSLSPEQVILNVQKNTLLYSGTSI